MFLPGRPDPEPRIETTVNGYKGFRSPYILGFKEYLAVITILRLGAGWQTIARKSEIIVHELM
jgi:hypothetical protein